jgi:hypothetical protein
VRLCVFMCVRAQLEKELQLGPDSALHGTLCLVHVDAPPGYRPRDTRRWFEGRALSQHFHIR